MKKSICLLLAILLLVCGCNTQDGQDSAAQSSTTTSSPSASGTTTTVLDGTDDTTVIVVGDTTTGGSTTSDTTGSFAGSNTSTTTQTQPTTPACNHKDADNNEICDLCQKSVVVVLDFYSINDLHGKFADADSNIGVDELTTYLKNARSNNKNSIFLSAGDMWQGSSESNMTKGKIIVDWMNELDFTAMAIGNHEFDWGEEYIKSSSAMAEFPFLAINIYDRKTNKPVDYCSPSVMIDRGGVQIGIIGAIGDCYSSIAVDKCDEVYFKTGRDLTNLVKAESEELRQQGADCIVYILHDGHGQSGSSFLTSSQMASYYDSSLSNGYVDVVFEGHTHQGYRAEDEHGVYHLQNRGDNKGGIAHVKIAVNVVTQKSAVQSTQLVNTSTYQNLEDDSLIQQLMEKYKDEISPANRVLGYNSAYRNSSYLQQLIAKLYYELGEKTWGNKYDIVLGGGFMSARSPYNLYKGDVTYSDIQSIFPFDNQITLCSVKGRDLRRKFVETSNDRYYIHYGEYGKQVCEKIDNNATYYIITDSYTAYYAYNNLTVVEEYDPTVFARDLLAEYIENGGLS